MAYYECGNKKHTVTVSIQMSAPNTGHQCTAYVYNDGKLIGTLVAAQVNNIVGLPQKISGNYIV